MNKYIVSYNLGKGSTSQIRYANSREEAMVKLCKQFGWDEHITWLSDKDWSDGIFTRGRYGYEFRIMELLENEQYEYQAIARLKKCH